MGKNTESSEWENRYLEAKNQIDQLPMPEQTIMAYDIEQIEKNWVAGEKLEGKRNFPVYVIGMQLQAANLKPNEKVRPTHVDTTLAVRLGIDPRGKGSKLHLHIIDRFYGADGEPINNRIVCQIKQARTQSDIVVCLGKSSSPGMQNKWCIKTVMRTQDARLEKALKKLGYSDNDRDKGYSIDHFLSLHNRAWEMVRQEDRERQARNK